MHRCVQHAPGTLQVITATWDAGWTGTESTENTALLVHSWCVPFNLPILMSLDFAYFEICWSISLMQLWIINRWAASCSAKQEVHYHLILTCEDKPDGLRMFHASWRQHNVQTAFSASIANMRASEQVVHILLGQASSTSTLSKGTTYVANEASKRVVLWCMDGQMDFRTSNLVSLSTFWWA